MRFGRILLAFIALGGTLHGQGVEVAAPDAYSEQKMLALWKERTSGTNLAMHQPVTFSPTPSYHLTIKGGTDATDLVDGHLCTSKGQAIWSDSRAVGWNGLENRWNTIIVDLGKPQIVAKVVWRVTAGCRKKNFFGPKRVRLSGSLDGKTVHDLCDRYRWANDVAATDAYHLPNIGPTESGNMVYVYPLELDVGNVRTRYVVVEFEMDGVWLASDELAVIAGTAPAREMAASPSHALQVKDVWVSSDESRYPLVDGFPLPLFLRQRDLRDNGGKLPVTYRFRLPRGTSIAGPPYHQRTDGGKGAVSFLYPRGGNSQRIGPFYLRGKVRGEVQVQVRAEGRNAEPQPWLTFALCPARLPAPFRLKQISASISWMNEHEQGDWPDFESVYARLGFNAVPTFPRAWGTYAVEKGTLDLKTLRSSADPASLTVDGWRLKRLREAGFRIIYMESPLHIVNWRYPKAASEYRCQLPGGPPTEDSFCPSYRGPYFRNEVRRIADHMLMIGGADMVMWDWELPGPALWLGQKCSRCQAEFAKTRMPWEAFVKQQTLDILASLNDAVKGTARARGWPSPKIGMYEVDAVDRYGGLFDYRQDRLLDFQGPSLYVGDDPKAVHDRIRAARRLGGDSRIIPYLTTGTCGYVTPRDARIIAWEALLNGAGGVTYYCFSDLNPAHLLEISRALAAVAGIEDVIVNGTPAHEQVRIAEPGIRHSAMRLGNRAGLLMVNTSKQDRRVHWRWEGGSGSGDELVPAGDGVLRTLTLAP